MSKSKRLKFAEILLLTVVWIVLIASPVLFREQEDISWQDLLNPLEAIIPLFILFLVNRFVLVPKLLFRKRSLYYLISVVGIIAVLTFASYIFSEKQINRMPPREVMEQHLQQPPSERMDKRLPPPHHVPEQRHGIPPFANFLIFSLLLVGFDTGLRISFRLAETEKEKAKLEKENVGTQLAFLRNQVSPHFFMNTLNNIHSLIDFDADEAKESIIRLSKLMRHLLYDSEVEKIPIKKEIDFIKNYVDLMKLRFSDKVKINLQVPDKIPTKLIPPLLFTSFVENAFKHGISYQNSSYINIEFLITTGELVFEIKNSNPRLEREEESSGIGVENSRKRLDLIYGNKYSLLIEDKENEHYVRLSIPL